MAVLYDIYIFVLNTYFFNKSTFVNIEAFWINYGFSYYSYSTNFTFMFTLKLMFCLSFLIFIRGGVPRYRYDFLTKIGWIKFLGYVVAIFVATLTLCYIV